MIKIENLTDFALKILSFYHVNMILRKFEEKKHLYIALANITKL